MVQLKSNQKARWHCQNNLNFHIKVRKRVWTCTWTPFELAEQWQLFWPKSPTASRLTTGSRTGALRVLSRRCVFFSLRLICVSAKVECSRITASAATTGVVRGQKSRLLLLPWLSIIYKLAWGAISQTNARKQRAKKKYCHLGILLSPVKRGTCDEQEPTRGCGVIGQRIHSGGSCHKILCTVKPAEPTALTNSVSAGLNYLHLLKIMWGVKV